MNDFDLARADFQKVLQLYPSNKAAKAQLVVCQQRIRKQLEKEPKKTMAYIITTFFFFNTSLEVKRFSQAPCAFHTILILQRTAEIWRG